MLFSRRRCERDGGGMVTIDTQNTEMFMHDFAISYKQQFWIGLYTVLVRKSTCKQCDFLQNTIVMYFHAI